MQAWKELLVACEGSRVQVTTVTDKIQFFAMVRELSMWMDGIMGQIGTSDSARYQINDRTVALKVQLNFSQETSVHG